MRSTPPSTSLQTFKEFEEAAWEQKAPRYDDTWGKVSSQPIEAILDLTGAASGAALLDIGCGPGHLCAAAARRGCAVTGADYSSSMLEIAGSRYPQISFRREDAERLSFHGASFDVVTMNFLLLHVADQERCLREAVRVLRPGGALVYSMWMPPAASPGLSLMFGAVKEFADQSVIPPAQDIFMFADRERCTKFFIDAAMGPPIFREYPSAWNVASGEEFFAGVQAGTRIGGMIDLQKPDIKSKIRERILSGIKRFGRDGGFHIPTPALLVAAKRVR